MASILDQLDRLGDEHPHKLLYSYLDLNGKRVQTGNTSSLIFDVPTLVSYVSQFMSLQPGDMISTGTPPGVGLGMKPPVFLKEGDVMELGIDKLGSHVDQGAQAREPSNQVWELWPGPGVARPC